MCISPSLTAELGDCEIGPSATFLEEGSRGLSGSSTF